jgi:predicted ATPase
MTTVVPLRLKAVEINAFKAVSDLNLEIGGSGLSLLIGPNGAGKTSILQALGFLRYFVDGRTASFFEDRHWPVSAIISQVREKRLHGFTTAVVLDGPNGEWLIWSQVFTVPHGRFWERVTSPYGEIVEFDNGAVTFSGWNNRLSSLKLDGSVLSALKIEEHPNPEHRALLLSLRAWAESITSLELLSPASMRSMARGKVTDIGVRGEKLGAFVASLPADGKQRIVQRLTRFYPQLSDLTTKSKRAGWIDFHIAESYQGRRLSVGTEHVSDGFLRLLALAAIPEFPKSTSLVLLDEAENGIDPLILPDFLEMIANESSAQIIATTHSPLLVNRFPPEAVHLLCRCERGRTIGARLADIPEFAEELEFRGAGEIWSQASLERITAWVRAAHERRQAEK